MATAALAAGPGPHAGEPALPISSSFAGHRTARRAVEILLGHDPTYRLPTAAERQALLIGFAQHGKALIGAAYDVVRLAEPLDLTDAVAVAGNISAITICEVKSTNRAKLKADLAGYFFNVTAAEQLTAQALGDRYRFVFVNTLTAEHQEMSLPQVLGRARAIYPAWHIRF